MSNDFPPNLEAYINRIGRTGRAGQEGKAFSFFTRNLVKLAPDLVKLLEEHSQEVDSYLRQLASTAGEDTVEMENMSDGGDESDSRSS